jgi:hypothetical protein
MLRGIPRIHEVSEIFDQDKKMNQIFILLTQNRHLWFRAIGAEISHRLRCGLSYGQCHVFSLSTDSLPDVTFACAVIVTVVPGDMGFPSFASSLELPNSSITNSRTNSLYKTRGGAPPLFDYFLLTLLNRSLTTTQLRLGQKFGDKRSYG